MKIVITTLVPMLLVTPVGQASEDITRDNNAVDPYLEGPVWSMYEALELESSGDDAVRAALEHGAYRWAVTIAANQFADRLAESLWADARNQVDPYATFQGLLQDHLIEFDEGLLAATVVAMTQQAESPARDVERLLFAAQFLVQAESSRKLADTLMVSAAEDAAPNYDTPAKRRVMVYPVAIAVTNAEAASRTLEGDDTGPDRSVVIDEQILADLIEAQGGPGGNWPVDEGGIIHRLARHLAVYERGLIVPGTSLEAVHGSLATITDQTLPELRAAGYTGARAAAAALDASWWLAQGPNMTNAGARDMTSRVGASLELVQYETFLLTSVTTAEDQTPWWATFPTTGISVLLFAGLAAVLGLFWLRRAKGRHLQAILCVGVLTTVLAVSPSTYADPIPTEPFPDPTPIVDGNAAASGVTMDSGPNGELQFAWSECSEPGEDCSTGRTRIVHRSYSAGEGEWSNPTILVDRPDRHAFSPRLAVGAGAMNLVWLEIGLDDYEGGHPVGVEVWWCRVEESECVEEMRLSESDADVGTETVAVAVGGDGRVRVAWSEPVAASNFAIVFRQQSSDGWRAPVSFPDGSWDQRFPVVDVDVDGTSYVAWLGRVHDGGGIYRVVEYATVHPESNIASSREYASQHLSTNEGVDILVRQGKLHVAYGTEKGLFHTVRGEDGSWTDAVNVSKAERRIFRPQLTASPAGVAALWMEQMPPNDGFRLRVATNDGGLWLAPATVLEPPHRALLQPQVLADDSPTLHVAWTGDQPPEPLRRVYYMTLSTDSDASTQAPNIGGVVPREGAWVRSDPVRLTAQVTLGSPLDLEASSWLVDGNPIGFHAAGDRLVADVSGLDVGIHNTSLLVRDQAGQETTTAWEFGVDRTPPVGKANIRGADGEVSSSSTGWWKTPLSIQGSVQQDTGAFAQLELHASRAEDGSTVLLGGDRQTWAPLPEEGMDLPEGLLLDVTVRARDAAGNVAILKEARAGWDGTAPQVELAVPDWAGERTELSAWDESNTTDGSPVTVRATITGAHGKTTTHDRTLYANERTNLEFEGLSEGRHTLSVDVRDEAGNVQEPPPGPWTIEIDRSAPALEVSDRGDATVLRARDVGVGIAFLQIMRGEEILAEHSGSGGESADLEIPSMGAIPLQAHTADVLGNLATAIIDPDHTLRVTGGSSDAAVWMEQEDTNSDGTSGWRERLVPGAAPTLTTAALLVLALLGRRRPGA